MATATTRNTNNHHANLQQELFGSTTHARKRRHPQARHHHQHHHNNHNTASEAAAIQQSLTRTQFLLQQELKRVSTVSTVIQQDSSVLKETLSQHYQALNVKKADQALTALQRAQRHEQQVWMAAVLFFVSCVAYVMWCRILIRIPFIDNLLELLRMPWRFLVQNYFGEE